MDVYIYIYICILFSNCHIDITNIVYTERGPPPLHHWSLPVLNKTERLPDHRHRNLKAFREHIQTHSLVGAGQTGTQPSGYLVF